MNARPVSIRLILALTILCSYVLGFGALGRMVRSMAAWSFWEIALPTAGNTSNFSRPGCGLSLQPLDFEILNLGLPSETVSGLSEPQPRGRSVSTA